VAFFAAGFITAREFAAPKSEKVKGIGGIFFKSKDPKALKEWYTKHLGLTTDNYGCNFEYRWSDDKEKKGYLLWAPFKQATKYFDKEFMINYRVADLRKLLAELKAAGINPVDTVDNTSYGKFVHILDMEGNKVELWEPNDIEYEKMIKESKTY
jgi:predicted enzyme related to lactoylglutathione lyase